MRRSPIWAESHHRSIWVGFIPSVGEIPAQVAPSRHRPHTADNAAEYDVADRGWRDVDYDGAPSGRTPTLSQRPPVTWRTANVVANGDEERS